MAVTVFAVTLVLVIQAGRQAASDTIVNNEPRVEGPDCSAKGGGKDKTAIGVGAQQSSWLAQKDRVTGRIQGWYPIPGTKWATQSVISATRHSTYLENQQQRGMDVQSIAAGQSF